MTERWKRMGWWRTGVAGAVLAASAVACGGETAAAASESEGALARSFRPAAGERVGGVPVDSVSLALRRALDEDDRPAGLDAHGWRRVRAIYEEYDAAPLWFDGSGLGDRADALLATLDEADGEGLAVGAYPLASLRDALRSLRAGDRATADEAARVDLLLTGVFVAYAEDMLTGQTNPREVSPAWHIDANTVDVDSAVARTFRTEPFTEALERLRPRDDDYRALRESLARYRRIVEDGGWTTVPEGDVLHPGDTAGASRLAALADRLRAEGYLGGAAPAPLPDARDRAIYDRAIAGAVARFQARHSIAVDSIVGPSTLASLNRPAEYRLRQIAANLERHRWLPSRFGGRYVLVNVPAFELTAFESGREALEMKVIVGAEYDDRSTPTFADSMEYVVFAPYWNVPRNIALNEILPKARRSPGYMEANHFEVASGWGENARTLGQYVPSASKVASHEVRIRQRPGPWNSLGQVKFIFPNDFAIYLHDTPADALFQEDVRAFSHGCIRVERPVDLAEWVLGWDESRVRAAMDGTRERVDLEREVPVYIVYFTAFQRGGELAFGNDLYDRDAELVRRMDAALRTAPEAERLVAELRRLLG